MPPPPKHTQTATLTLHQTISPATSMATDAPLVRDSVQVRTNTNPKLVHEWTKRSGYSRGGAIVLGVLGGLGGFLLIVLFFYCCIKRFPGGSHSRSRHHGGSYRSHHQSRRPQGYSEPGLRRPRPVRTKTNGHGGGRSEWLRDDAFFATSRAPNRYGHTGRLDRPFDMPYFG